MKEFLKYKIMKKILLLFTLTALLLPGIAQEAYRVYFTDKKGVEFDPYEYFDQKAIDRRLKAGISLYDKTDYPVNQNYVNTVSEIADSMHVQSRWFNFVLIYASSENQLAQISNLEFVDHIEKSKLFRVIYASETETEPINNSFENLAINQTERMGSKLCRENNIDGKGLRIAVFDGGFPNVDVHPAFKRMRDENRLVLTFDFVKNREHVYYGNKHGLMTLSNIGGYYGDIPIGMATGAEFMLAKTEINREPFSEEEYWLAAAEWADKNGADIINSSLGYGYHRYFTSEMDGKTSLVAKAAKEATRKGILVVNSAGNEATAEWETIITPADVDSVLSIGGIDPDKEYHISFSSYGPTADKRMKPNVSAYGHVVAASGEDEWQTVDGTSFASPLTAGFAACAWQTNRDLTNLELFIEIEKSAHLYPYFDYAHGYGIPQASYFINKGKERAKPTFNILEEKGQIKIVVNPIAYNKNLWVGSTNLLFYHIENAEGVLEEYYVVSVQKEEVLSFKKSDFEKGQTLRVHFRGYTDILTF
jgi:serine protease AprX